MNGPSSVPQGGTSTTNRSTNHTMAQDDPDADLALQQLLATHHHDPITSSSSSSSPYSSALSWCRPSSPSLYATLGSPQVMCSIAMFLIYRVAAPVLQCVTTTIPLPPPAPSNSAAAAAAATVFLHLRQDVIQPIATVIETLCRHAMLSPSSPSEARGVGEGEGGGIKTTRYREDEAKDEADSDEDDGGELQLPRPLRMLWRRGAPPPPASAADSGGALDGLLHHIAACLHSDRFLPCVREPYIRLLQSLLEVTASPTIYGGGGDDDECGDVAVVVVHSSSSRGTSGSCLVRRPLLLHRLVALLQRTIQPDGHHHEAAPQEDAASGLLYAGLLTSLLQHYGRCSRGTSYGMTFEHYTQLQQEMTALLIRSHHRRIETDDGSHFRLEAAVLQSLRFLVAHPPRSSSLLRRQLQEQDQGYGGTESAVSEAYTRRAVLQQQFIRLSETIVQVAAHPLASRAEGWRVAVGQWWHQHLHNMLRSGGAPPSPLIVRNLLQSIWPTVSAQTLPLLLLHSLHNDGRSGSSIRSAAYYAAAAPHFSFSFLSPHELETYPPHRELVPLFAVTAAAMAAGSRFVKAYVEDGLEWVKPMESDRNDGDAEEGLSGHALHQRWRRRRESLTNHLMAGRLVPADVVEEAAAAAAAAEEEEERDAGFHASSAEGKHRMKLGRVFTPFGLCIYALLQHYDPHGYQWSDDDTAAAALTARRRRRLSLPVWLDITSDRLIVGTDDDTDDDDDNDDSDGVRTKQRPPSPPSPPPSSVSRYVTEEGIHRYLCLALHVLAQPLAWHGTPRRTQMRAAAALHYLYQRVCMTSPGSSGACALPSASGPSSSRRCEGLWAAVLSVADRCAPSLRGPEGRRSVTAAGQRSPPCQPQPPSPGKMPDGADDEVHASPHPAAAAASTSPRSLSMLTSEILSSQTSEEGKRERVMEGLFLLQSHLACCAAPTSSALVGDRTPNEAQSSWDFIVLLSTAERFFKAAAALLGLRCHTVEDEEEMEGGCGNERGGSAMSGVTYVNVFRSLVTVTVTAWSRSYHCSAALQCWMRSSASTRVKRFPPRLYIVLRFAWRMLERLASRLASSCALTTSIPDPTGSPSVYLQEVVQLRVSIRELWRDHQWAVSIKSGTSYPQLPSWWTASSSPSSSSNLATNGCSPLYPLAIHSISLLSRAEVARRRILSLIGKHHAPEFSIPAEAAGDTDDDDDEQQRSRGSKRSLCVTLWESLQHQVGVHTASLPWLLGPWQPSSPTDVLRVCQVLSERLPLEDRGDAEDDNHHVRRQIPVRALTYLLRSLRRSAGLLHCSTSPQQQRWVLSYVLLPSLEEVGSTDDSSGDDDNDDDDATNAMSEEGEQRRSLRRSSRRRAALRTALQELWLRESSREYHRDDVEGDNVNRTAMKVEERRCLIGLLLKHCKAEAKHIVSLRPGPADGPHGPSSTLEKRTLLPSLLAALTFFLSDSSRYATTAMMKNSGLSEEFGALRCGTLWFLLDVREMLLRPPSPSPNDGSSSLVRLAREGIERWVREDLALLLRSRHDGAAAVAAMRRAVLTIWLLQRRRPYHRFPMHLFACTSGGSSTTIPQLPVGQVRAATAVTLTSNEKRRMNLGAASSPAAVFTVEDDTDRDFGRASERPHDDGTLILSTAEESYSCEGEMEEDDDQQALLAVLGLLLGGAGSEDALARSRRRPVSVLSFRPAAPYGLVFPSLSSRSNDPNEDASSLVSQLLAMHEEEEAKMDQSLARYAGGGGTEGAALPGQPPQQRKKANQCTASASAASSPCSSSVRTPFLVRILAMLAVFAISSSSSSSSSPPQSTTAAARHRDSEEIYDNPNSIHGDENGEEEEELAALLSHRWTQSLRVAIHTSSLLVVRWLEESIRRRRRQQQGSGMEPPPLASLLPASLRGIFYAAFTSLTLTPPGCPSFFWGSDFGASTTTLRSGTTRSEVVWCEGIRRVSEALLAAPSTTMSEVLQRPVEMPTSIPPIPFIHWLLGSRSFSPSPAFQFLLSLQPAQRGGLEAAQDHHHHGAVTCASSPPSAQMWLAFTEHLFPVSLVHHFVFGEPIEIDFFPSASPPVPSQCMSQDEHRLPFLAVLRPVTLMVVNITLAWVRDSRRDAAAAEKAGQRRKFWGDCERPLEEQEQRRRREERHRLYRMLLTWSAYMVFLDVAVGDRQEVSPPPHDALADGQGMDEVFISPEVTACLRRVLVSILDEGEHASMETVTGMRSEAEEDDHPIRVALMALCGMHTSVSQQLQSLPPLYDALVLPLFRRLQPPSPRQMLRQAESCRTVLHRHFTAPPSDADAAHLVEPLVMKRTAAEAAAARQRFMQYVNVVVATVKKKDRGEDGAIRAAPSPLAVFASLSLSTYARAAEGVWDVVLPRVLSLLHSTSVALTIHCVPHRRESSKTSGGLSGAASAGVGFVEVLQKVKDVMQSVQPALVLVLRWLREVTQGELGSVDQQNWRLRVDVRWLNSQDKEEAAALRWFMAASVHHRQLVKDTRDEVVLLCKTIITFQTAQRRLRSEEQQLSVEPSDDSDSDSLLRRTGESADELLRELSFILLESGSSLPGGHRGTNHSNLPIDEEEEEERATWCLWWRRPSIPQAAAGGGAFHFPFSSLLSRGVADAPSDGRGSCWRSGVWLHSEDEVRQRQARGAAVRLTPPRRLASLEPFDDDDPLCHHTKRRLLMIAQEQMQQQQQQVRRRRRSDTALIPHPLNILRKESSDDGSDDDDDDDDDDERDDNSLALKAALLRSALSRTGSQPSSGVKHHRAVTDPLLTNDNGSREEDEGEEAAAAVAAAANTPFDTVMIRGMRDTVSSLERIALLFGDEADRSLGVADLPPPSSSRKPSRCCGPSSSACAAAALRELGEALLLRRLYPPVTAASAEPGASSSLSSYECVALLKGVRAASSDRRYHGVDDDDDDDDGDDEEGSTKLLQRGAPTAQVSDSSWSFRHSLGSLFLPYMMVEGASAPSSGADQQQHHPSEPLLGAPGSRKRGRTVTNASNSTTAAAGAVTAQQEPQRRYRYLATVRPPLLDADALFDTTANERDAKPTTAARGGRQPPSSSSPCSDSPEWLTDLYLDNPKSMLWRLCSFALPSETAHASKDDEESDSQEFVPPHDDHHHHHHHLRRRSRYRRLLAEAFFSLFVAAAVRSYRLGDYFAIIRSSYPVLVRAAERAVQQLLAFRSSPAIHHEDESTEMGSAYHSLTMSLLPMVWGMMTCRCGGDSLAASWMPLLERHVFCASMNSACCGRGDQDGNGGGGGGTFLHSAITQCFLQLVYWSYRVRLQSVIQWGCRSSSGGDVYCPFTKWPLSIPALMSSACGFGTPHPRRLTDALPGGLNPLQLCKAALRLSCCSHHAGDSSSGIGGFVTIGTSIYDDTDRSSKALAAMAALWLEWSGEDYAGEGTGLVGRPVDLMMAAAVSADEGDNDEAQTEETMALNSRKRPRGSSGGASRHYLLFPPPVDLAAAAAGEDTTAAAPHRRRGGRVVRPRGETAAMLHRVSRYQAFTVETENIVAVLSVMVPSGASRLGRGSPQQQGERLFELDVARKALQLLTDHQGSTVVQPNKSEKELSALLQIIRSLKGWTGSRGVEEEAPLQPWQMERISVVCHAWAGGAISSSSPSSSSSAASATASSSSAISRAVLLERLNDDATSDPVWVLRGRAEMLMAAGLHGAALRVLSGGSRSGALQKQQQCKDSNRVVDNRGDFLLPWRALETWEQSTKRKAKMEDSLVAKEQQQEERLRIQGVLREHHARCVLRCGEWTEDLIPSEGISSSGAPATTCSSSFRSSIFSSLSCELCSAIQLLPASPIPCLAHIRSLRDQLSLDSSVSWGDRVLVLDALHSVETTAAALLAVAEDDQKSRCSEGPQTPSASPLRYVPSWLRDWLVVPSCRRLTALLPDETIHIRLRLCEVLTHRFPSALHPLWVAAISLANESQSSGVAMRSEYGPSVGTRAAMHSAVLRCRSAAAAAAAAPSSPVVVLLSPSLRVEALSCQAMVLRALGDEDGALNSLRHPQLERLVVGATSPAASACYSLAPVPTPWAPTSLSASAGSRSITPLLVTASSSSTWSPPHALVRLAVFIAASSHSPLSSFSPHQLVRDAAFSHAASADPLTSLYLAQCCHSMARRLQEYFHSEEFEAMKRHERQSRELREVLYREELPRLQAALAAATAANSSDAKRSAQDAIRTVQQRIRAADAELAVEERQRVTALQRYDLYRRSALNAYARLLAHTARSPPPLEYECDDADDGELSRSEGSDTRPNGFSGLWISGSRSHSNSSCSSVTVDSAVFGLLDLWLLEDERAREEWMAMMMATTRGSPGANAAGSAAASLEAILNRVPSCCFRHVIPLLTAYLGDGSAAATASRSLPPPPFLTETLLRVLIAYPAGDGLWSVLSMAQGHLFTLSDEREVAASIEAADCLWHSSGSPHMNDADEDGRRRRVKNQEGTFSSSTIVGTAISAPAARRAFPMEGGDGMEEPPHDSKCRSTGLEGSTQTNAGAFKVHRRHPEKILAARQLLQRLTRVDSSNSTSPSPTSHYVKRVIELSGAYLQLASFSRYTTPSEEGGGRREVPIPSHYRIRALPQPFPLPLPTVATTTSSLCHEQVDPCDSLSNGLFAFDAVFRTPGGLTRPKKLRVTLCDGRQVHQLLKSGDDLRQDAALQRFFHIANVILGSVSNSSSSSSGCSLRTYGVVPLAPCVGVIGWMDHTVAFGEYIAGPTGESGAHGRYFPGELTSRACRQRLTEASNKAAELRRLHHGFSPALHYFFFEHATTPLDALTAQHTYQASLAVCSMTGYAVGLGDRHGSNLLLCKRTSALLLIDFGYAFDQGMLLPIPEQVPFRLTPNVVDGLGVRRTHGALPALCSFILHTLRSVRPLLLLLLSSIAKDPLTRWSVGRTGGNTAESHELNQEGRGDSRRTSSRRTTTATTSSSFGGGEADRALAGVSNKLIGIDPHYRIDGCDVGAHVRVLLEEAQNVDATANMFVGWSPWM